MNRPIGRLAVIDDDEDVRESLTTFLMSAGYVATPFASAEAFLAAAAQTTTDVVISDVKMPGMSGLDLTSLLARRPAGPAVILISALASPEVERRAHLAGAVCLLAKPLKPDSILNQLERTLRFPK